MQVVLLRELFKMEPDAIEKVGFMHISAQICVCESISHILLFCNPMDCSLPGSSVHGVLQARILEWVAVSFSRGSSPSKYQTQVSALQADSFPYEPPGKPSVQMESVNFSPTPSSEHQVSWKSVPSKLQFLQCLTIIIKTPNKALCFLQPQQ